MIENNIYKTVYDSDNISKYYISPYCHFSFSDNTMYIWREDSGVFLTLNGTKKQCDEMISLLQKGMDLTDLSDSLTQEMLGNSCSAEDWILMGIKGGIIE